MRNTIFLLLQDLRTLTRIYGGVIAREVMVYDEVAKLKRTLQEKIVIEKKQDGRKKK